MDGGISVRQAPDGERDRRMGTIAAAIAPVRGASPAGPRGVDGTAGFDTERADGVLAVTNLKK